MIQKQFAGESHVEMTEARRYDTVYLAYFKGARGLAQMLVEVPKEGFLISQSFLYTNLYEGL